MCLLLPFIVTQSLDIVLEIISHAQSTCPQEIVTLPAHWHASLASGYFCNFKVVEDGPLNAEE